MEQASQAPVHPARDEWRLRRDEWLGLGPGGSQLGSRGRVSIRAIYVGIAAIVVVSCLVNAFSAAYDLARLGRPHRYWEPFVWEASSAVVVIALLALPRYAAILAGSIARRPLRAGILGLGLALLFSAVHICGMVLLRMSVYAALGGSYSFNWSVAEVLYELRKDLLGFTTLAIVFWLAERAFGVSGRGVSTRDATVDAPAGEAFAELPSSTELWLRDGRTSILVDAREVLWVASAGNYVEYAVASGRRHLIRSTLQAEEARLSALGIARIHRTRLINLKRVVAISGRPSGDFELRLDTGETIVGSRRYRGAVAGIGA
jgi:hypothetical protein